MLITKRIAHLTKYTQFHIDNALKQYNLSTGLYPFLLALDSEEGVNLDCISKKIKVDKAMTTRSVKKLMDLEYIEKCTDAKDSRACQLFLTDKARCIIPHIQAEIAIWNKEITSDLSQEEIELFDQLLDKIFIRASKH
ncbi:MAG: MarR family winged helix-turn-helix transcriptional regulator [Anaerocolumna sp.]